MNINLYTEKAREAIVAAQQLTVNYGQSQIAPEHLLLALLREQDGIVPEVVRRTGSNVEQLRRDVEAELKRLPKVHGSNVQPALSPRLTQVLNYAEAEARRMGDQYVSTEHQLIALIESRGPAGALLLQLNLAKDKVLQALNALRGNFRVNSLHPEAHYWALEKYGRDLTELALLNKLDPVIGREEEIRRTIQVLSRRTKNNPVLIGEPGVGKTAIVEGLALRVVRGDVPEALKNKKIVALDLSSMVAGSKYRGEFEERMQAVLNEVQSSQGNIVLFIDELHTVVGAGSAEGSVMDAGNMLKPALARGELHAIGATTLDEYRKHIEKDAALERRFQPVTINEPTVEDTVSILRGLKERYETHHQVRITDGAIVAAAMLSDRYIADRFLPDKAIDLVDEAAARLRMAISSDPAELDDLKRRMMQLEIEREALKREVDRDAQGRRERIEQLLATLNQNRTNMELRLATERAAITRISQLKEQIEQCKQDIEQAQREYDYNRLAELQYGTLAQLQAELTTELAALEQQQERGALLREEVSAEDIAETVAKWTGIPVSKLMLGEADRLRNMEHNLHQRVIGQDAAIRAVSNAVRRARAGLNDPDRPLGSFLFLGPTGVGKTELARALAEFLFDDEHALIRIDMSEYMEKHSVARLVGAPPGYVGYDEGGQLTEAVRRKPFSVVLLDEVEKAHPDVFNILLQVLDDGRLTDSQGRVVNFQNVVVIMTSNLGSHAIQQTLDDPDAMRDEVMEAVEEHFPPEFLNRVDDTVIFQPLTEREIAQIVRLQVERVSKRLGEQKIKLELSDRALRLLANMGYDPRYGARPLKRAIQREVLDLLALELIDRRFQTGDTIVIDADGGELTFEARTAEQVTV
ncbi:MAG: ATP-dependent chaperone ClpB [Chloroflexi bacterium]|nr:MAG: ATP-dependent chaperone ClpB [Chloroflexota bacterium]